MFVNYLFLIILSLQGLSSLITFSLLVSGVPREALLIVDLLPNERIPVNIYFPFSLGGTNFFTLDNGNFMRFSGFFREPGVAQVMYIYFMAVAILFLDKWKGSLIIMLFMGVLMSLSTTSLATFPVMLLGILVLKTKNVQARLGYFFLVPLILVGVYSAPYIGIQDKFITHTHSIETRIDGLAHLSQTMDQTFLLGEGMFSKGLVENSSINFILSLRENGIFGIALFCLFYIVPYFFLNKDGKIVFFTLTSTMLITILLSQPIFYSVLNIFIFVNSYLLAKKYTDGLKL
jgi:hypothetical protein